MQPAKFVALNYFAEELPNGWELDGKTGAGDFFNHDDLKDKQIGWFIGWIQKEGRAVAFAREPLKKMFTKN